jgi:hypothetical protein
MVCTNADLFLDAIILLLNVNNDKSKHLVHEIIKITNESPKYLQQEDGLIKFYIRLIQEIINNDLTKDDITELTMMLIKFKSDPTVQKNEEIYHKLQELFSAENQINPAHLQQISDKLNNVIIWHKANAFTRQMFANVNRCSDCVDVIEQRKYLDNIHNISKDIIAVFDDHHVDGDIGGLVDRIDFTDISSIQSAYAKYADRKVNHVMRTGLQGLNRMFGKRGGLSLGESVVFNALSHHFKSGILMSMAKWIVKYNLPPENKDGKKPLILFITLENEAHENMMWWFKHAYETTTGNSADGMLFESIIAFLYDYFNEKGYTFVVERYLPSDFGIEDFINLYSKYENSGYFIVAAIIDYMNNMKKSTSSGKSTSVGNHLLVKELYNTSCNFTKSKGTALITAHQLNRGAADIAQSGQTNVVKKFGPSHIADSMDVQREVDMEIYMHIEKNHLGDSFLTLKRGKHRYVNDTPEAHKYIAYKFGPYGIPDDIETEDLSVRDIYAEDNKPHVENTKQELSVESLFS